MIYRIGVDAGGTHTAAVAYGPQGERLAETQAGPGNGTAGGTAATENILAAIAACRDAMVGECSGVLAAVAGNAVCVGVLVGMAGLDPAAAPALRALFSERLGVPCAVISDGELALCAVHQGGDGLLIIAGTGSIAYGRHGGTLLRRGGWGHILGDEGSAYAIVTSAIRQGLDDLDDGQPEHPLTQALLRAAQANRLRELVERVYSRPKADIAVLAPVVAELAATGDQRAADILTHAGQELARMAAALSRRLELSSPQVALSGGILAHVPPVRWSFEEHLMAALPDATILRDTLEPQRAVFYWTEP